MRRSPLAIEHETLEALKEAIEEVGLTIDDLTIQPDIDNGRRPDALITINGQKILIEVKSVLSNRTAQDLVVQLKHYNMPALVASDRIADSARQLFREEGIGYFDRRGHLRLRLPGVVVDTEVSSSAVASADAGVLDGAVAKEVALVLLANPKKYGVREIAGILERAPSSVLVALRRLRDAGLVTSSNEPVTPELFWQLEGEWHRNPIALAEAPAPIQASKTDQLQLGLFRGDKIGWALTDTRAASEWGMAIVASSAYPPDFYVPTSLVLQRAIALLGKASDVSERGCTVSLPSVPYVCKSREMKKGEWPLASHIVVALDLAQDRSRGREILERWSPPDGIQRVW